MINQSHLIMGCHALEEICKYSPDRIIKVFYLKLNDQSQERKNDLITKLKSLGIKLVECSKKELDKLCSSDSHQGVAAHLKERKLFSLDSFFKQDSSKLVVALDSIYDPHNLGSILRACECFDVGLVIWSKNRGALLSPVVAKTSSSASEFVPIHLVSNLATSLDLFKREGYTLIGAQISPQSQNLYTYTFPEKSVLILGSEGKGIRSILQNKLDDSIMIPMYGKIDSLNVSQAAAISIGMWRSQQNQS